MIEPVETQLCLVPSTDPKCSSYCSIPKQDAPGNSAVLLETDSVFPERAVAPLETQQECLHLISLKMKVVLLWWASG